MKVGTPTREAVRADASVTGQPPRQDKTHREFTASRMLSPRKSSAWTRKGAMQLVVETCVTWYIAARVRRTLQNRAELSWAELSKFGRGRKKSLTRQRTQQMDPFAGVAPETGRMRRND